MKFNRRFLAGLVISTALITLLTVLAMNAFAQSNDLVVATNGVASTNVVTLPPAFEQVADLLGPKAKAALTKVIIWIGSLSLIIAPFSVRLGNWLRDKLNTVAENKGGDMDKWLAKLFSNPAYRFVGTLLRFINVNLPTSLDLERALKLQAEAAAAQKGIV